MNELKSGYRTTEFWVTVLPFVLILIKQIAGVELEQGPIVDGILGLVGVVTAVTYIVSRFKLKYKQLETGKPK